MTESCLVEKLGKFIPLQDADTQLLLRLEEKPQEVGKYHLIHQRGDMVEYLYVVKQGWVSSFSVTEDGRRQILRIFYPGDIIDLAEISNERAAHDVKTLTPAIVCPFEKDALKEIFTRSPSLTALMFSMTVQETNILLNRIRAIGRFSAYERLCYLLLEIASRLSLLNSEVHLGFKLPLTQSDLADLLGLTNVYVSKTLARIEADGLIERRGTTVRIIDEDRMRRVCEFNNPVGVDTSWFPTPVDSL